jgi:ketosteroid isomerase-like protein
VAWAILAAFLAISGSGEAAVRGATPLHRSFDLEVPVPPTPVTVTGRRHLVYELHLTSFASEALVLRSVDVLDADDGAVLATLRDEDLAGRLSLPGPAASAPAARTIAPGMHAVLYLEVALGTGDLPRVLEHRVAYAAATGDRPARDVVQGGRTRVQTEPPPMLGPPLRGGPWAAVYNPSQERGHRRVVYAVQGRARIPGRFAVDWVRLDADGRSATGDDDRAESWHGYGAPVLAVAAAVVAAVRDDIEESASLSAPLRHPLEDAAGNHVTLDLGRGRFAAYEHLAPGSIRVAVGDRVERGQVIAAVGFTGHSTMPHLHFHVADANSPLDAEGMPFVLEGFDLLGSYDSRDELGKGPWTPRDPALERRRSAELPAPAAVVDFGSDEPVRPSAEVAGGDTTAVEAELRALTQELLDAVAPGRVEVWERILAEDLVHLDENGVVRDKAALLAEIRPLPAGLVGRIEVDRFRVEVNGDTAIAAVELQESLDYHGQPLRTRFRSLDSWRRTPQGWRLAGQHVAAVLADPPAIELPREDLCAYSGVYSLTPAIATVVRCTNTGLTGERPDRPATDYLPEVRDVFFAPGQPRSRRLFTRDASGRVDGFVDRREGEDVRWTRVEEAGSAPEHRRRP